MQITTIASYITAQWNQTQRTIVDYAILSREYMVVKETEKAVRVNFFSSDFGTFETWIPKSAINSIEKDTRPVWVREKAEKRMDQYRKSEAEREARAEKAKKIVADMGKDPEAYKWAISVFAVKRKGMTTIKDLKEYVESH